MPGIQDYAANGSHAPSEPSRLAASDEQMKWREVLQTFILGKGMLFRGHYSFKEPVEMNRGETGRLTLSFSDADTFTFRGRAKIQTVISGLDMAPRHW